ncbi:MAG: leucine-rich repeat protein [Lachnoclostridium sp.]|nr:leucine-rich repeat protein [Lachnoclostridium sp.]
MIKKLPKRASASLPTLLWLMLLALLPAQLSARDFEYTYEGQTLTYTVLDEDAKTVETTKEGGYNGGGNIVTGDVKLPATVYDGDNEYSVVAIGNYAFFNCRGLTSIDIPNSVITIGKSAFRNCEALTSISIPNSVTTIGELAFSYYRIKDITVEDGDSPISFGFKVFEGSLIENLYIGRNWTWPSGTFQNAVAENIKLGNSVTTIGESAFSGYTGLTSIDIPNSVTSIGKSAFASCIGLTSIDIPNSVTSIGESAFFNCTGLTSIDIPNSVTSIGKSAFKYCSGLTSVDIPESVTSIGESAFSNCSGLTSIDIPNSVTSIGESAFSNCSGLTSVLIPNSVTSIGDKAFYGCSSLKKSAFPSSIGNPFYTGIAVSYPTDGIIEDGYIWNKDKTELYFAPLSVEGEYTLPESVASIGRNAFTGCGLTTVNVNSAVVPMMDSQAFAGLYDNCLLNVPDNLFADYMTTSNWHLFENINDGSSLDNGNFKYRTNPGDATAILVGPAKSMTEATILAKVSLDNKMYAVKAIGIGAFEGQNLTKVTFRDGIEIIADKAFYKNDIQELVLPESVKSIGDYAFAENTNLASANIGSGVETIGDYAFYKDALAEITIPASVKTLGDYAFAENTNLASANIGSGVETIGDYAFYKDALAEITIPASVKTIGDYAFAENSSLASATIGSSVEAIGDYAFYKDALAEITIPASVKTIGNSAFANNSKLASATIGSGVETIGGFAFAYNYKLASVTIGSGVEVIGNSAFQSDALTEVVIPASVKTIGNYAFSGNANLASVTIGSGVEAIGNSAFQSDALTEVVIPASVKTIGNYAFSGNVNLASVTIGSGVETIGDYAFQNDALAEVVIPGGVKKVGSSAFVGNKDLTTVVFSESVDTVTLDTKPFDSLTNLTMGRNFEGVLPTATNIEFGNLFTEITENFMANTTSLESVKFGTGISEIPANAFKGCSLSEIVIPSNITTIGESAFENNKLTNVIIGCGTAEIGNNAFAYNNSIAAINVTAVEPPVATDDVFSTQDAQLNVLKESREAYENAVCWYQFEGLDLVPVSVFKILNESVPSRAADANAKQLQFTVSVEPANASLKEYIFWESSNPAVATVDNNGLVTFTDATEGTAEITAKTLYDGVVASATVTAEGTLGIDGVIFDANDGAADSVRPNDIYNLQGVCLKRNASQADIDALFPGFYIVGGKKVLVK